MRRSIRRGLRGVGRCLAVLGMLLCAQAARGAEVAVDVDTDSIYAGIPFSLRITVRNATEFEVGGLPATPGIEELSRQRSKASHSTLNVNGRITETKTEVLVIKLVAREPGVHTIPAFIVTADGATFESSPIVFTAMEAESDGLLFVEVSADQELIYLGQPVELTLSIWIEVYQDQRMRVELSGDSMWSLIRFNDSEWGNFIEPIRQHIGRRGSRPNARRVERAGENGDSRTYHLFQFTTLAWPKRVGEMVIKPVAVLMQFPLELRRSFFGDLEVVDALRVVAAADLPRVNVVPIPESGRPATYTGAVGRFDFTVTAKPRVVAVGDPITLTMKVKDLTPRGARLDVLPPPPLRRVASLTDQFQVPVDTLAGVVEGKTKTFTQTVRANSADVVSIPAIPFTYFDPERQTYVTIKGEPIEIEVSEATMVNMADIIGAGAGANENGVALTERAGGVLANFVGDEVLRSQRRFSLGWGELAVILLPPFLFGVVAVGHQWNRRMRGDQALVRQRRARRSAMHRLRDTEHGGAQGNADRVAAALSAYVADRFNLPSGSLTGIEVVRHLRQREVSEDLVREIDALLSECQQQSYGGVRDEHGDILSSRATECIDRLERERIQ